MKKLIALAIVILLLICPPVLKASECYKHRLTVARHVEVNINNNSVDIALSKASELLKISASDKDYSCCIELVREGDVGVFGEVGDGLNNVKDPSTLRDVWHISNHKIKVVESIELPGYLGIFGTPEPKEGQAYPGLTLVVVQSAQPVIWAHEFGHFQQILTHRNDSVDNIMSKCPSNIGIISQEDCKLIQEGGIMFDNTSPEIKKIDVSMDQ